MKNLKGILTIIGLIGLGFTAGFFTHRQVTIKQVEKVREIGQAPGFQRHLLKYLEPTEEQKEQLAPIIRRYGQQMGDQMKGHRQERRTLVDNMHEEIKPLLTEEQLEKLNDFSKRFRGRRDKNGQVRRPKDKRSKDKKSKEQRPEQTGLEN